MASAADNERRKGKRPRSPDEMVLVAAADGVEVPISRTATRLSQVLRGRIDRGCGDGPIRVPCATGRVLAMVVAYCEKHAPLYDFEAPERDRCPCPPSSFVAPPPSASSTTPVVTFVDHVADPHGLKAWDEVFIRVDKSTLFDLIFTAVYLDIEDLLVLGCRTAADMMGKKLEEIRDIFNLKEQLDKCRRDDEGTRL